MTRGQGDSPCLACIGLPPTTTCQFVLAHSVPDCLQGFKSFRSARNILAGIELMHMIGKGQLLMEGINAMSFADQFYALAGQVRTA